MMTKSVKIVNNLTGIEWQKRPARRYCQTRKMSGSSYPYHFIFIVFIKGFIMEEILSALVGAVNLVLWDYLLIYALIGIGLFFTLYLGAPQITKLGAGFKSVSAACSAKRQRPTKANPCLNFKRLP